MQPMRPCESLLECLQPVLRLRDKKGMGLLRAVTETVLSFLSIQICLIDCLLSI
jgi:hypothetical protein